MIMDNKRAEGSPDGAGWGEQLASACYVSPVFHPPRTLSAQEACRFMCRLVGSDAGANMNGDSWGWIYGTSFY